MIVRRTRRMTFWNLPRPPALGLALAEVILAGGLLVSFALVASSPAKAILLLLGVGMAIQAAARTLIAILPEFSDAHASRVASSGGVLAAALFAMTVLPSPVWLGLMWVITVGSIAGCASGIQRTLLETALSVSLRRAFAESRCPTVPVPLVYVLARHDPEAYFAHLLAGKVMQFLWQQKHLSPSSGLRTYVGGEKRGYLWKHRQRAMILLLVSDSFRKGPRGLQRWLVANCSALIFLETGVGSDEVGDPVYEEGLSAGRLCAGPVLAVRVVRHVTKEMPLPVRDDTILWSRDLRDVRLTGIVAPLAHRLAATALPVSASDAQLRPDSRSIIGRIAIEGCPPLADAYLRFRLAQSDVERFLCLLESVEALLRLSAITALAARWAASSAFEATRDYLGKRMTLGGWVRCLRNLVEDAEWRERSLVEEVLAFWRERVTDAQRGLASRAAAADLCSHAAQPHSQLDWLDLLTELRNKTRGHGVVSEEIVAPLWHPLHQVVLDLTVGLCPLALSSSFHGVGRGEERLELRGWRRGSPGAAPAVDLAGVVVRFADGASLPLYPLAIAKGSQVLLFDHEEPGERVRVYLDFATGERCAIEGTREIEVSLHDLWSRERASVGGSPPCRRSETR